MTHSLLVVEMDELLYEIMYIYRHICPFESFFHYETCERCNHHPPPPPLIILTLIILLLLLLLLITIIITTLMIPR